MTNMRKFHSTGFLPVIMAVFMISGIMTVPGCRGFRKKPNIVFIFCDQMSPRAMGWTGQMEVKTPHLDDFSPI